MSSLFAPSIDNSPDREQPYERSHYVVEMQDGSYSRFVDSHLLGNMLAKYLNFKNIEEMIREDPNIKISTIFKAISLMQFEDSVYREI